MKLCWLKEELHVISQTQTLDYLHLGLFVQIWAYLEILLFLEFGYLVT